MTGSVPLSQSDWDLTLCARVVVGASVPGEISVPDHQPTT